MNDWIWRTNVYEVNLRQYTAEGTITAFVPHLPRLKDMGVETLWFMPVTPIAQLHKKGSLGSYYACADYTSVAPEFGTIKDFENLVQTAHRMGMKVILDWVANHTGWDHWWTKEHPDWYKKESDGRFKKASGMDDIIELNFDTPSLRKAMIDAMRFWVTETGIDGFRCDLAFWVRLDFWVEAKAALERGKPLFWLAELDPVDHPEYMQVFDAAYTWTWMRMAERYHKSEVGFGEILRVLDQYQRLPGAKAWFTTNHDENTWNGTEYEKYGGMAKALAVFSCTWPGLPLVYSGQELPNYERLAFFEKDVIEWTEKPALHHFYKTLFRLRTEHACLGVDGLVESIAGDEGQNVLGYLRRKEGGEVAVLLNFSGEERWVHVGHKLHGPWQEVFTGLRIDAHHQTWYQLLPWGFAVLVR